MRQTDIFFLQLEHRPHKMLKRKTFVLSFQDSCKCLLQEGPIGYFKTTVRFEPLKYQPYMNSIIKYLLKSSNELRYQIVIKSD